MNHFIFVLLMLSCCPRLSSLSPLHAPVEPTATDFDMADLAPIHADSAPRVNTLFPYTRVGRGFGASIGWNDSCNVELICAESP
jgi:hypothetical protein